ncbi:rhamnulokinase family protein [uncultured Dubosiella sp.]|uniref:rhamnulokinase n=1 Tax=uncultured Dubosiella sp. TaxID=1937011 RepID=UPI0025B50029|nr:rhamnulokinase family protein [uncultured Dubosiella sp.]
MNYYLAVDIGASSGRHILGSIQNGQLVLEEIFRFENNVTRKKHKLIWDDEYLFEQILSGMKKAKELGKIPTSMAVDTWAVDFALLDETDHLVDSIQAYRDASHVQGAKKIHDQMPFEALYALNGLQYQPFNSIYQLANRDLSQAKSFLMVPDYFAWKLTGHKTNELTNLSTTGLLNVHTRQLDEALLGVLDCDKEMFQEVKSAGEVIGSLLPNIQQIVGYDCDVVACASHDTASAYMAAIGDEIILSSGTWSLLGILSDDPIVNEKSRRANYTHEGAPDRRIRFLKNIMGLWIIQEVKRDLRDTYSFAQLVEMARTDPYPHCIDVNQDKFLKPECMSKTIRAECKRLGYPPVETVGQLADCVYRSLAFATAQSVEELEHITNKTYQTINVVGGGCQNEYLNELIADATGKTVIAGPVEATAIGNLCTQMNHENRKALIKRSFPCKTFKKGKTI